MMKALSPADLNAPIEFQSRKLIEVKAHEQLGMTEAQYRDELQAAAKDFQYRTNLTAINQIKVAVVDFRLPGRFLARIGGINCWINPDDCNDGRVVTPKGTIVIQGRWGPECKKKAPRYHNFWDYEEHLTVKEGLTIFLYEGPAVLRNCPMELGGSLSLQSAPWGPAYSRTYGWPFSGTPRLELWGDTPTLYADSDEFPNPRIIFTTRGKLRIQ